jgi:hypothetical protein
LYNKKILFESRLVNLEVNSFHKTYESIFTFYIGVYNLAIDELSSDTVFKTSKIMIHENFDQSNLLNDIAVVKLERPVIKTKRSDRICLSGLIGSPNLNIETIPFTANIYALGKS